MSLLELSEKCLVGGQALTALFICPDSQVPGEGREGVAGEELSDTFERSAWPALQLAVSFLVLLYRAASTLTVNAGRRVWEMPVLCASIW